MRPMLEAALHVRGPTASGRAACEGITAEAGLEQLRRIDFFDVPAIYGRDGGDLQNRGLYVDATPWQASVFVLTRTEPEAW